MSSPHHELQSCNELSHFCSQDGVIDNDSLRYTIVLESGNQPVIEIEFEERLTDRCDTASDRVAWCGQMCPYSGQNGGVLRAQVVQAVIPPALEIDIAIAPQPLHLTGSERNPLDE